MSDSEFCAGRYVLMKSDGCRFADRYVLLHESSG